MDNRIQKTLARLHSEANREILTIAKGLAKGIFRPLQPNDMKDAYIAMSAEQGTIMHDLILQNNYVNVTEFGFFCISYDLTVIYKYITKTCISQHRPAAKRKPGRRSECRSRMG